MLHNRHLNNKINILHERCLRLVYIDKQSRFEKLLFKDSFVSIHHRNKQSLTFETFKVKNRSSRKIMNKTFQLRDNNHYNLRQASQFIVPHVNGIFNGSKSVSLQGQRFGN